MQQEAASIFRLPLLNRMHVHTVNAVLMSTVYEQREEFKKGQQLRKQKIGCNMLGLPAFILSKTHATFGAS